MYQEEKWLHEAEKAYAEKYWSDSEGSKIIGSLGFRAGAVHVLKAIKHQLIISEAKGDAEPLKEVMGFIDRSLGIG